MIKNNFKQFGYDLFENVIEKEIVDIISNTALFEEIQKFSPGDGQVPGAHSSYASPVMESLLLFLQNFIETKTDLNLYPTYSYYRVYRKGDILHPHTDRPSCEISASVCLNYSYNESKYSWPLIVNENKINMKSGDLVVYRGIDLNHSREEFLPPNDNDWHVQAFLHYVDADGKYSDLKFDRRQSVGYPRNTGITKKKYITYT